MLQIFNKEIYEAFMEKVGDDWYTPTNANQLMGNGEFDLCDHLWQGGMMERKKENGVIKYRVK
jgi:hypothetical protein